MGIVPAGFVKQAELDRIVAKAARKLGKDAVRTQHSLGTDSTGAPAIYFRIVLSDAASREDRLAAVANQISNALLDEIRPLENWGLLPYFSYRSQSEQRELNDPEWA